MQAPIGVGKTTHYHVIRTQELDILHCSAIYFNDLLQGCYQVFLYRALGVEGKYKRLSRSCCRGEAILPDVAPEVSERFAAKLKQCGAQVDGKMVMKPGNAQLLAHQRANGVFAGSSQSKDKDDLHGDWEEVLQPGFINESVDILPPPGPR